MGNRFASGKYSIAECDRCGQRYKLKQLKFEVIKTKLYQLKVCDECWDLGQIFRMRLLDWIFWVILVEVHGIRNGAGILLVGRR